MPPAPPPPYVAPDIYPIAASSNALLRQWVNGNGKVVRRQLTAPVWLAAKDAPLEVRYHMATDGTVTANQVFYEAGARDDGRAQLAAAGHTQAVPAYGGTSLGRAPSFVRIQIVKNGATAAQAHRPWCSQTDPWGDWEDEYDSGLARLDQAGSPERPTYPKLSCAQFEPYQLGAVFGQDQGWARKANLQAPAKKLPAGTYELRVMMNASGHLAESDITNNEVSMNLTVRTIQVKSPARRSDSGVVSSRAVASARRRSFMSAQHAPDFSTSNAAAPTPAPIGVDVPDLESAPSFGIRAYGNRRRDRLSFGALTWNAGPGKLEVEAFRESGNVLQAYQVFYNGWSRAARQARGAVLWHAAPGHHHFHFQAFARYRLLDAAHAPVRDSGKNSWCIVETNKVDDSLPGFDAGLRSFDPNASCGTEPGALWARLSMAVGYGDYYMQDVAGQAFDITGLPNGTYYIEITANPDNLLAEADYDNNVSLRRIRLGGTRGARTVRVFAEPTVKDRFAWW
jgi:hypothetical protein